MTASSFTDASMSATIVRVRDVAASVAWFEERLGLSPLHVGADGSEHPIAAYSIAGSIMSLWQLPPGEQRDRADNDRNSYLVIVMRDDISKVRDALASRGVTVGQLRTSANNEFFWFYDLDDNRFEVSRPITAEFRDAARAASPRSTEP
jgi:hypothetical protein